MQATKNGIWSIEATIIVILGGQRNLYHPWTISVKYLPKSKIVDIKTDTAPDSGTAVMAEHKID